MTTERTKLLERILKLHRKAESAKQIGSEAEAETFAAAVQRMLIQHDLEISDIEYQLESEQDPVKLHHQPTRGKKRRVYWTEIIAVYCAEAHLCAAIPIEGTDAIALIGRRKHREVADFMITTLIRLAEKLADEEYTKFFYACQEAGDVAMARGFRGAFLTGFANRLARRYSGLMLETQQQATSGVALVRLSNETQLVRNAVEELTKQNMFVDDKDDVKPKPDVDNGIGFMVGMQAADKVNLRANAVKAGDTRQADQVGAGQKLLPGA